MYEKSVLLCFLSIILHLLILPCGRRIYFEFSADGDFAMFLLAFFLTQPQYRSSDKTYLSPFFSLNPPLGLKSVPLPPAWLNPLALSLLFNL